MPGIPATSLHPQQQPTLQPTRRAGTLVKTEEWWRDHYYDIERHGYTLRPRYHPLWVPSWIGSKKDFYKVEDGQANITRAVMDATRAQDSLPVMLKRILPEEGPHELSISRKFSSSELAGDRRNHCVTLLDVIELEGPGSHKLMVFPLLRPFDRPRFQTFGEFVAFFTQICEGIQFMHERNVAHRDCTANNIMLDPSRMYPDGFHPVKIDRKRNFKGRATAYTRIQRPPRYILIDFGLSRQYPSRVVVDSPLRGGDKSAPEHRQQKSSNPFYTDIYYIGNLVREKFMMKYRGFSFMEDLIAAMTSERPEDRPCIEEVIERFTIIRKSLSKTKLRSALTSKRIPRIIGVAQKAGQYVCTTRLLSRIRDIFWYEYRISTFFRVRTGGFLFSPLSLFSRTCVMMIGCTRCDAAFKLHGSCLVNQSHDRKHHIVYSSIGPGLATHIEGITLTLCFSQREHE